ncbi:negative elongation factor A [Cyclospora cayetanensis]|uniref:Negative elongation factor A n=1 Tax=Cyclospora cayetanensis TaxID=88456 RepID=A0A6P6RXM9_9EIME|nr:negative elongation factor A [Cyclospora cayetanensis]
MAAAADPTPCAAQQLQQLLLQELPVSSAATEQQAAGAPPLPGWSPDGDDVGASPDARKRLQQSRGNPPSLAAPFSVIPCSTRSSDGSSGPAESSKSCSSTSQPVSSPSASEAATAAAAEIEDDEFLLQRQQQRSGTNTSRLASRRPLGLQAALTSAAATAAASTAVSARPSPSAASEGSVASIGRSTRASTRPKRQLARRDLLDQGQRLCSSTGSSAGSSSKQQKRSTQQTRSRRSSSLDPHALDAVASAASGLEAAAVGGSCGSGSPSGELSSMKQQQTNEMLLRHPGRDRSGSRQDEWIHMRNERQQPSDNQLRQLGVHFSRYDNSWVARLHVGGKILKKYFSSKLYGFERAREKALQARRDMELDLLRSQRQQQQEAAAAAAASGVANGGNSSRCSVTGSNANSVTANTPTSFLGAAATAAPLPPLLSAAAVEEEVLRSEEGLKKGMSLFHSAAAAAAMMLAQQQVMQQLLLLQMHSSATAASTAQQPQQRQRSGDSLLSQAETTGYALQLEQLQRLQQLQQLQQLHQQQFATTFLLAAAGCIADGGTASSVPTPSSSSTPGGNSSSACCCSTNGCCCGTSGDSCSGGLCKLERQQEDPEQQQLLLEGPSRGRGGTRTGYSSPSDFRKNCNSSMGGEISATPTGRQQNGVTTADNPLLPQSGSDSPFAAVASLLASLGTQGKGNNSSSSLAGSNTSTAASAGVVSKRRGNTPALPLQEISRSRGGSLQQQSLSPDSASVCSPRELQQQVQQRLQQLLHQLQQGQDGSNHLHTPTGMAEDQQRQHDTSTSSLLPCLQDLLQSLGAVSSQSQPEATAAVAAAAAAAPGGHQQQQDSARLREAVQQLREVQQHRLLQERQQQQQTIEDAEMHEGHLGDMDADAAALLASRGKKHRIPA